MPINKKRLDDLKTQLNIIMKSTTHYCEMSDKLLEEFDIVRAGSEETTPEMLAKLEDIDKQMSIVQGKILSEQKTQEKFEEEYSDVIEYLHSDD